MGGPAYIDGKKFREFDNFYPCHVTVDDVTYPSAENAFQAAKSSDKSYKRKISEISPGRAWEIGQTVNLSGDWEDVKVKIMENIVRLKLVNHPKILEVLLSTNGKIEFMRSSDFWNRENARILEKLREEFRK